MRHAVNAVSTLVLGGWLALSFAGHTGAQEANLVITGATVIDGTGAPPGPGSTIIIRDGRIATVESGPPPLGEHRPRMPVEMIREIVDEATRQGLPVVAHVSSSPELEAAVRGGASTLAHAVIDDPALLDDPFLRASVAEETILGANPLDDIRNTRSLEIVVSEGRIVNRQADLGDVR